MIYNANNQLTQWGSATMSYDLDGNTLNDGTNAYVWDARNRLVSANSGGAAYAYDPLGRRILKTLLSSSTGFLYDGVNPVQELNGTTPTANLLTGGVDERFQRTDSTGTYSYLTDALGSTMALTDSTGAQQATYSYGPYGSMSITGSTTNSYGYTGRESDGLGIDYYRARYYNPQTGRFISEDPMGFRAGPNFYAYAGDDPIDFIDPFGMDRGPNGCGGNDGTPCNDPWLPYENQLPWDQQSSPSTSTPNPDSQSCWGTFGYGGLEGDLVEGGGFAGGIWEDNSVYGNSGGSLVEGWIGGEGPVGGVGKITSPSDTSILQGWLGFVGGGINAGPLAGLQVGYAAGSGWGGLYVEGHVLAVAAGTGAYLSPTCNNGG